MYVSPRLIENCKHLKCHTHINSWRRECTSYIYVRQRGGVTNWPAFAAHTALLHTEYVFFFFLFLSPVHLKSVIHYLWEKQKRIKWIDKSEWHWLVTATCNEASLKTNWNSTCEHVCACACTSHLSTTLCTDFCFLAIKQTAKEIKWDEKTVQYHSVAG